MSKLGFPCHLTGSGMAFPWQVIRDSPALRDNLVEDLVMGLDMALAGHPPLFCPDAKARSVLPEGKAAATAQRTRWEHGQLATLVSRGPQLLRQSLLQRRPELAALAADLMVPPLALLVSGLGGATFLGGFVGAVARKPLLGVLPPLLGLGLVSMGTFTAWSKFARNTVPLKVLLMAPFYVGWKVPMYLSLAIRGRQKAWVRTERSPQGEEPSAAPAASAEPPLNGMSHTTAQG
jgi:cellulose synthase/poly-beta-1,6-N-acetylglucosamine synthase-like glycosyltransferase